MKKSVTFTAMPDVGRQTHVGDIHFAAQDVSSPSTVVDSEADSLHTATHAGSTIQRPMAVAAKKSPLEDVDLSALFLVPQNRKSPHMRQFLFKEIKKRLIRKYGSLERAFLSVDISGDGSISFNEFHSLLKSMHIILTNRFSRSLFDKVSGGDKMLSYDEFVTALMASTLEKVTLQMKQIDRNSLLVQNHVNTFIRRLVFASEENKSSACDRYQRKFTPKLLNSFWGGCRKYTMRTGRREFDARTFIQLMKVCRSFLSYEEQFMAVIHSAVDRNKSGTANIMDMVTTLVLMTDWEKRSKLSFLFKMVDFDSDDCLTSDQILVLFVSILIHSPIVLRNKTMYEANIMFNDELALQEARRLFHVTMDSLDLADGARSLLNFEELFGVFQRFPFMLESLIPGVNSCRWVLHDRPEKSDAVPPLNGTGDASSFRRDVSMQFLTAMREEPTEQIDSKENWTDVHRQTFQSWAEKAFLPAEKVQPQLWQSQSEPVLAAPSLRKKVNATSMAQKLGKRKGAHLDFREELPAIQVHHWGKESVPRFLMYSTTRSSWLRGHTMKNTDTMQYRCRVCSDETMDNYHSMSLMQDL
eukprot:GEMP01019005.1.p1 GENE.GEMP01019005.1~~GEMP01019005.1.p1  ORF type:complete len:584 (+),score=114.12 GEMP01019005.1:298-2049(+)